MPPVPISSRSRILPAVLALVVSVVALLPWWRNHDYLRDFYDYGLFINVNARLAQGQRPFADFTTPAQSATFLLNYAAERAGGGTYLGLTYGAAAVIILGAVLLTLLLARRFNPWAAALLALAIVIGSASQHTIVFYNPLGVLSLALVVWSFAVAPLLRRETFGWHLLAAAGLFLGGINKINFHLLACVMALGWVVHAWAAQKAPAPRALLTLAFIAAFGFILPIGTEIAWTGAGWNGWYYNVVQLPLGARGGRLSSLLSPGLYFTTLHNYYGQLRVPQVGLIGVLMPLLAIVAAWRAMPHAPAWRRVFLILAGVLAAFASSALLLTNNEIAYVTFAAALVITVGLWLGFGPAPRGPWFAAGALLPAFILAAAGGESAWRGDRSQFGHDREPRAVYWRGEACGPDYAYIRGLHLPPGLAQSLVGVATWRNGLPGGDSRGVFYGPGAEWLEHVWPERKVKDLPLVAGAFDGPRESELLQREVLTGTDFKYLLVVEAWDHWGYEVEAQLNETAVKERLNSVFKVYRKLPPGTVSARPLEFMYSGFGGNVDSMRVISGLPRQSLPDQRLFLGLAGGTGTVEVGTPCNRMSAEYVVARAKPGSPGTHTATLTIHARMPDDGRLPRWQADITLPEGVDEIVVATDPVDGSGLPLSFGVSIPPDSSGKIIAGWRAFRLLDTPSRGEPPPILRPSVADLVGASDDVRAALLPSSLQDTSVQLRGGWVQDGRLLLPYGTEAWIQATGLLTDIRISTQLNDPQKDVIPNIQVVYYKAGRLEPFMPVRDDSTSTVRFNCWTPEPGGWIGILADHQAGSAAMLVKVEAATRH